jgi:hypothetical protein
MCRVFALLAGLLLLAGCGGGGKKDDLPATHPVKGRVVDAKGNPLKGGTVQFDSGKGEDLSVMGVINSDGTFSVKTFRDKAERDGAPEGDYQVTVMFLLGDSNAPPAPYTMPNRFKVEPKDNTLDIDLRKK